MVLINDNTGRMTQERSEAEYTQRPRELRSRHSEDIEVELSLLCPAVGRSLRRVVRWDKRWLQSRVNSTSFSLSALYYLLQMRCQRFLVGTGVSLNCQYKQVNFKE